MVIRKSISNRYKKITITGAGSITTLLLILSTLYSYGIFLEGSLEDFPCSGQRDAITNISDCIYPFNISITNYSLAFGRNFQVYLNDSRARYEVEKKNIYGNFKPFNLTGKTLNVGKHEFRVLVYKYTPYDNVKLGVDASGLANIDPVLQSVADIVLVDEYNSLTEGYAHLKITPNINYVLKGNEVSGWVDKISTNAKELNLYEIRIGKNSSKNVTITEWISNISCSNSSVFANGTWNYPQNCIDFGYANSSIRKVWAIDYKKVEAVNYAIIKNEPIYVEIYGKWTAQLGDIVYKWRVNISNWISPYDAWLLGYTYAQNITVCNQHDNNITEAGYTANYTFNHSNYVTLGYSQADGDDIRIVYGQATELDRVLMVNSSWNILTTNIQFKIQANISAGVCDKNYEMYFGNSTVTNPPNNITQVFWFADDFEDNSLNATKWFTYNEGNGKITESGGRLRTHHAAATGSSTIRVISNFGRQNLYVDFVDLKIESGASDDVQFGIQNGTAAEIGSGTKRVIGGRSGATAPQLTIAYLGGIILTKETLNYGHNISMAIDEEGSISYWNNTRLSNITANYTAGVSGMPMNNATLSASEALSTIANISVGEIRTRIYITPEPNATLGVIRTSAPTNTAPQITNPLFTQFFYSDSGAMANMTFNYTDAEADKGNVTAYCMNNSGAQEISRKTFLNVVNNTFLSYNCTAGDPAILDNWTIQANATDSAGLAGLVNMTSQIAIGRLIGLVVDGSNNNLKIAGAEVIIINQTGNKSAGSVTTNSTGGWVFNLTWSGNYTIAGFFNMTLRGAASPFVSVT